MIGIYRKNSGAPSFESEAFSGNCPFRLNIVFFRTSVLIFNFQTRNGSVLIPRRDFSSVAGMRPYLSISQKNTKAIVGLSVYKFTNMNVRKPVTFASSGFGFPVERELEMKSQRTVLGLSVAFFVASYHFPIVINEKILRLGHFLG
jgi:hypothetical protein